jgi:translation elongation factor EF-Ts
MVKELRDRTNAGFNDWPRGPGRKAAGDIEKAIAVLRKKGLSGCRKQ